MYDMLIQVEAFGEELRDTSVVSSHLLPALEGKSANLDMAIVYFFKELQRRSNLESNLEHFRSEYIFNYDEQIQQLHIVINGTLNAHTLQNGIFTFKGVDVALSRVEKAMLTYTQETIHEVRIFAVGSIVFDQNLEIRGKNVAIFAPNWTVQNCIPKGFQETNFVSSGERPECTTSYMRTRDRDETKEGFLKGKGYIIDISGRNISANDAAAVECSADGRPGLPGESAGHFYGAFETISGFLQIFMNGGKGGDGQDGADGCSGEDGGKKATQVMCSNFIDWKQCEMVEIPDLPNKKSWLEKICSWLPFHQKTSTCKKNWLKKVCNWLHFCQETSTYVSKVCHANHSFFDGLPGQDGGKGEQAVKVG